MSESAVRYELRDRVALISLDDGRANAMPLAVVAALDEARVRAEEEASAALLVGRAGRFSAGFDLKEMMAGPESARGLVTAGAKMMTDIFTSPIPWVAACTGHAMAGGAIMLMACDRRLGVSGGFKIGLNEVSIGMRLPIFALELAKFRLAPTELTNATLFAKVYDPEGAVVAGYLDEVVDGEEILARALAEAQQLGELDRVAFGRSKTLLRGPLAQHVLSTLEEDLSSFG